MYAQKQKGTQQNRLLSMNKTTNSPRYELSYQPSQVNPLTAIIQRQRAEGWYRTKEATSLRQTAAPHDEIIAVPNGVPVKILDNRVNNFAVKLIPRDHRWASYGGQVGWIASTRLCNNPDTDYYWNTYQNNNAPALFSLANLRYVSVSNGIVGSIYFDDAAGNNGRIRLNHPSGPAVESHVNPVEVYTHTNVDAAKPNRAKLREGIVATRLFMTNNGWKNPPRVGEYVYELWANGANHPSRGQYTLPVNITQNMINVLYHAVHTEHIGNSIMSKLRNNANMASQINE